MFLDESMTNKGVGRLVAENSFNTLFENGFESISISPAKSNVRAINVAKRLGFEEESRVVPMVLSKSDWMAKKTPISGHKKTEEILGEAHG